MSDIAAPAARTAARRSSPEPWSSRRTLQTCLALIWLLDAALQFQPYMFSGNFVTKIIEPAAAGDPAVVAAPVTWSARIMAGHIVAANAAFAMIPARRVFLAIAPVMCRDVFVIMELLWL